MFKSRVNTELAKVFRRMTPPDEVVNDKVLKSSRGQVRPRMDDKSYLHKATHRHLTIREKEKIIFRYYGCTQNVGVPIRTKLTVSKMLRIPYATVHDIIRFFIEGGCAMDALISKRRKRFEFIAPAIQTFLLNDKLLQLWRNYTLRERVVIIQSIYSTVKISQESLRRFYHHHKIKFRATKQVYWQSMENRVGLDQQRGEYALLLAQAMVRKREICYVDESSYFNQITQNKAWASRQSPCEHGYSSQRYSFTVFGAVGDCLN